MSLGPRIHVQRRVNPAYRGKIVEMQWRRLTTLYQGDHDKTAQGVRSELISRDELLACARQRALFGRGRMIVQIWYSTSLSEQALGIDIEAESLLKSLMLEKLW